MTDYSVRYRCQGTIIDGRRCIRRGWRTSWAPGLWLCWQHVRVFCHMLDVGREMLLFEVEKFL